MYGVFVLLANAVRHHSKIIVMQAFVPDMFLEIIQDYKVKRLFCVPPMILFLAQSPMVSKYDLSSLERIGCGAAPLGAELLEAAQKRLKVPIGGGYGMSEVRWNFYQ